MRSSIAWSRHREWCVSSMVRYTNYSEQRLANEGCRYRRLLHCQRKSIIFCGLFLTERKFDQTIWIVEISPSLSLFLRMPYSSICYWLMPYLGNHGISGSWLILEAFIRPNVECDRDYQYHKYLEILAFLLLRCTPTSRQFFILAATIVSPVDSTIFVSFENMFQYRTFWF